MKKKLTLSILNISLLLSFDALAQSPTKAVNSPFITNVKGTIMEDFSSAIPPRPLHSTMRLFSLPMNDLQGWFNWSPVSSNIQGVGAQFVYDALLPPRIPKTILVAVLDSGVDIDHEDLKNNLWTNKNEIPNNGIDDDNNGYIDDVHGWNFLGNKFGENVDQDTLEVTREYKKYLDALAEQQWLSEDEITYYEQIEEEYLNAVSANRSALERIMNAMMNANNYRQQILTVIPHQDFSVSGLTPLTQHESPRVIEAAKKLITLFDTWYSFEYLESRSSRYQEALNYHYNLYFDTRRTIVDDDITDPWEKGYGNNLVKGPSGRHGTHVAGIIAAERGNNIGIDGIAQYAKIMAVRVVPNGDERDKDIANAVRYAVDNGANIINMSFGKSYSPHKFIVDHAFRYAAQKGVLIVHSAGNSSRDNDMIVSYPNRYAQYDWSDPVSTWLDVGASAKYANQELVASFSNFGQNSVDIFAPGHNIMSTTPGNNYESLSGTSMAAPVVSGVAALVWSQNPELSAVELKEIIMKLSRTYPNLLVKKPSTPSKLIPFKSLSISGGIVDAEKIFTYLSEKN